MKPTPAPNAPGDTTGSELDRFDAPFRAVIAVPKGTIDKEEAKWKKKQAKKRAKKAS